MTDHAENTTFTWWKPEDKKRLLADLAANRISAKDFKKRLLYPPYNPIVTVEPRNPSGELSDDDICGMFGSKIFEPMFYEGMTYGEYKRRCLDNPNESTERTLRFVR